MGSTRLPLHDQGAMAARGVELGGIVNADQNVDHFRMVYFTNNSEVFLAFFGFCLKRKERLSAGECVSGMCWVSAGGRPLYRRRQRWTAAGQPLRRPPAEGARPSRVGKEAGPPKGRKRGGRASGPFKGEMDGRPEEMANFWVSKLIGRIRARTHTRGKGSLSKFGAGNNLLAEMAINKKTKVAGARLQEMLG